MNRTRIIGLIATGILAVSVLLALGFWQVRRLDWKTGILAEMQAMIDGPAIPMPESADPEHDQYRAVSLTGQIGTDFVHVLSSDPFAGPGYQVIVPFDITGQGRRVLVDLGYVAMDKAAITLPPGEISVLGNLLWAQDTTSSTPPPDTAQNLWFARDVGTISERLDTEPLLVVARTLTPQVAAITPRPVSTERVPNNHLQYAITWFSLAAIWAGMTVLALWRIRRGTS